jgi:uncharacterized protein
MKLRLNSLSEGRQEIRESLTAAELLVENPPFSHPIAISLQVDKEPQEVKIDGLVTTTATFECDRCLIEFTQELQGDFHLLVTQATKSLGTASDEDLITISPTTSEIDLTRYIYDTLILSIPMKKLCDPACRGLCPSCGANLNFGSCQCPPSNVEKRWTNLHVISNPTTEE